MHDYLKQYAEQFHLIERIRFATTVKLIDKKDLKNPNLPWLITIEATTGDSQTLEFDFVVVAQGLFSTPERPILRGQHRFTGSIAHITELKSHQLIENKRVAVIGGAKSAVDMASLAARHGLSCHMIFSHSHWILPHEILRGYIPLECAFTRLFTGIFEPFPYAPHSALFHFAHRRFSSLFTKITDMLSQGIVAMYRSSLFNDEKFVPKGSIRNAGNIMRVTSEFVQLVKNGRIDRKLASVDEIIDGTTIRLDSGELLQADVIVFATGFIEMFPFLSDGLIRALIQAERIPNFHEGVDLDLYRRIVPVGIPNIAFIGLPAPIHTWMFYEVQCHWTSDYFLGRLNLPRTEEEMYEEIHTTRQFIHEMFKRKSYYFQYYWLEPMEIYLQDMGIPLHRTSNCISEYFGVYRPKRIATLHEQRQAKAEGRTIHTWYFGLRHTVLLLVALLLFTWFFF
jgi:dimethylaniline monooxygenase (N-oxide forming)